MTPRSLYDLYVHQLQDLYSAESQIIDALPTMADKAMHEQLKNAFRTHLEETKSQRDRLRRIFDGLEESPDGHTCKAMKGLIAEAKEFIGHVENIFADDAPGEVVDAGLIANAQRVEHYEIAGYGTVCTFAEILGRDQDVRVLKEILAEEKRADERLTEIAMEAVNPAAATI
ncbi:ferritin-like domain-containing protein [soil metagenome]